MVRAANAWSKRDLAIAAAAVAMQAYATSSGFGGPCALLLLIIAPFVFGRDAWDGETSAYSVFNGGRRIAGTFTAEQFDAQLHRPNRSTTTTPVRPSHGDDRNNRQHRRPSSTRRPVGASAGCSSSTTRNGRRRGGNWIQHRRPSSTRRRVGAARPKRPSAARKRPPPRSGTGTLLPADRVERPLASYPPTRARTPRRSPSRRRRPPRRPRRPRR